MTETLDLNKKALRPDKLAELAIQDEKILQALLQGITPEAQKANVRENSSKVLIFLAENQPEVLLPYWTNFIKLLKSENGFSKYVAIHVITLLVQIDKKGLFEKVFDVYYGLLDDESVMVASHLAGTSGKIAKAKPALQPKITQCLLAVDKTHFNASRQALIKSYIIEAFSEYFEESEDKAMMIAFVKQQVDCESPKTRRAAKVFLQKWEGIE